MSKKTVLKPLAVAVGAALATSMIAPIASADASPFSATSLSSGYMQADLNQGFDAKFGEGKCGEGKCGGDSGEGESHEGEKGGEGGCGGDKGAEGGCGGDKGGEGGCGGDKGGEASDESSEKGAEGKCGEGKCGGAV